VAHEKCDVEVVEKRGIELSKKVLQILMNAVEYKFGESGEDKACGRRQRSACWVGARSRRTELKTRLSSLIITVRAVAIVSGEIYPELGIS